MRANRGVLAVAVALVLSGCGTGGNAVPAGVTDAASFKAKYRAVFDVGCTPLGGASCYFEQYSPSVGQMATDVSHLPVDDERVVRDAVLEYQRAEASARSAGCRSASQDSTQECKFQAIPLDRAAGVLRSYLNG